MRTVDERIAAVERRVRELEREKGQRRHRFIGLAAVAACLAIVVSVSTAMPHIIAGLSGGAYGNRGIMASIFYRGKALGYVLVGLLSFSLGVCLTILCFLLQPQRQKSKGEHEND